MSDTYVHEQEVDGFGTVRVRTLDAKADAEVLHGWVSEERAAFWGMNGLTEAQTYRHVLLPQAFRIILPPLTSEFMNVIKNSSVALTIGLLELTGRARAMQEFSFRVFEAFTAATVIYLLTNLIVVLAMRALEKKVRVPGLIAASGAVQAGH